jgi:hypothetical protein
LQLRNEESKAYRTLAQVRLSAPKNDQLIQRLTALCDQISQHRQPWPPQPGGWGGGGGGDFGGGDFRTGGGF